MVIEQLMATLRVNMRNHPLKMETSNDILETKIKFEPVAKPNAIVDVRTMMIKLGHAPMKYIIHEATESVISLFKESLTDRICGNAWLLTAGQLGKNGKASKYPALGWISTRRSRRFA